MEKDELDEFLYGTEEASVATEGVSKPDGQLASPTFSIKVAADSVVQPESIAESNSNAPEENIEDAVTKLDDDDSEDEDEDDLEIVLDDSGNDIQDGAGKEKLQLKPAVDASGEGQDTLKEASMDEVLPLKGHININGIGEHEMKSILDLDIDQMEDKPWRRPGADLTDYFNYGFNENSWRAYAIKQKQMREDAGLKSAARSRPDYPNVPDINALPYGRRDSGEGRGGSRDRDDRRSSREDGYGDGGRRNRRSRSPPSRRDNSRDSRDRDRGGYRRDRDWDSRDGGRRREYHR